MNKYKLFFLIIITMFLLLPTSSFAVSDAAMEKTVNAFYNLYLRRPQFGLLSDKEQQKLKPYITASLREALRKAQQVEDKYLSINKDVPPLVEGDLFTSNFEGAKSFKVLSCEAKRGFCLVEFKYINYTDKTNEHPSVWKDKIYLVNDMAQGWLVDDIEFLGNWQFMHKGRLKQLLQKVANTQLKI